MTSNGPIAAPADAVELEQIVDGLRQNREAVAALEAEAILSFAAAMNLALARMAHRPQAVQMREMELRSIAAEIGVALRWSDRTVQRRMGDALQLTERFPATVAALSEGRISLRHATVIEGAGWVITDADERAAFERVVLERAAADTPARTKAFATALAERLHPESITARFERAEETRAVTVAEVDDGMAELRALLPATLAWAIHDRLTQQARAIRAAAAPEAEVAADADDAPGAVVDTRSLDQVRADLLCDLVLTGQPAVDPTGALREGGLGAITAMVQLTVPVTTAAGVDDRGAFINGTVPVDAGTARCLMAGAPEWERLLTDPVTGAVRAVDRYRPTAAMKRYLLARDGHCRFPGCRHPARTCDLDHSRDWALGGETDTGNLAALCRRHHALKTETPWCVRQLPDGTLRWTTPLQRQYDDTPLPRVFFVPDDRPPPF